MIIRFTKALLLSLVFMATSSTLAVADLAPEPEETQFLFTFDGKPYRKPFEFELICEGYKLDFVRESPKFLDYKGEGAAVYAVKNQIYIWLQQQKERLSREVVYSYQAHCPDYGCRITKGHYLNYTHINSCHIRAYTPDGDFLVKGVASTPAKKQLEVELNSKLLETKKNNLLADLKMYFLNFLRLFGIEEKEARYVKNYN